ncbi:CYTH domain-containing protein [Consotaella aegiceratis]|uniref:CYTH domain-containing protein n=1 Tax=Consotaella aegiceratis TaxID=3097961 RepID=UPI002F422F1F
MAIEIERRFLIKDESWRAEADGGVAIRQFYLAARPGFSTRVRVRDEAEALLTLKAGSGLTRHEFEYPVPLEDARGLEASCMGAVIEKRRHKLAFGRHTVEIDVFAGALAPLVLAEIEYATEEESDAELPAFLGREVTHDGAYNNAALALNGLPADFRPR